MHGKSTNLPFHTYLLFLLICLIIFLSACGNESFPSNAERSGGKIGTCLDNVCLAVFQFVKALHVDCLLVDYFVNSINSL